jgi:hypothetical protein
MTRIHTSSPPVIMIRDVIDNTPNLQALVSNYELLRITHCLNFRGKYLIGKERANNRAPEHREIRAYLGEASLQIIFFCY